MAAPRSASSAGKCPRGNSAGGQSVHGPTKRPAAIRKKGNMQATLRYPTGCPLPLVGDLVTIVPAMPDGKIKGRVAVSAFRQLHMTLEQVRSFYSAEPFRPFVIHLADG